MGGYEAEADNTNRSLHNYTFLTKPNLIIVLLFLKSKFDKKIQAPKIFHLKACLCFPLFAKLCIN